MRPFLRSFKTGFTLTEIMFSVLILASTMIPIAAMMGRGFDGTRRDQRQIVAIQLCQSRLNQALSVPFARLVSSTTNISSGTQLLLPLGDVVVENFTFNVRLQVAEQPVSYSYLPVDVNAPGYSFDNPTSWVFGPSQNLNINANVARLATVVVTWSEHGKQQQVALSTYKANLEL